MKILVINGPNLNMLGKRPKEHYGVLTLDEINSLMLKNASNDTELRFYQSNYEGDIVTKIQEFETKRIYIGKNNCLLCTDFSITV